jgi:hypothetical protein
MNPKPQNPKPLTLPLGGAAAAVRTHRVRRQPAHPQRRRGGQGGGPAGARQGFTFVRFSAQLKRLLWDRGCV